MRRKSVVIVLVVLGMLSFSACAKKGEVSREMYDALAEELSTVHGVRVDELEGEFMSFIHHVYSPNTTEEIGQGIDSIAKYLTDTVDKDFRSMIVEVEPSKSSTIRDVEVRYSRAENNSDELPRVYAEFMLESEGLSQKKAIEFVFNPEGKIFRYYFWEGILDSVGD